MAIFDDLNLKSHQFCLMTNFEFMLSSFEHEKSVVTSGPGLQGNLL